MGHFVGKLGIVVDRKVTTKVFQPSEVTDTVSGSIGTITRLGHARWDASVGCVERWVKLTFCKWRLMQTRRT